MINIFGKVFDMFYKIKVVHSIPGRLRVHIPAIKNIPSEWQIKEDTLNPIFLELQGVESISFSYISGNAVIQYDKTVTNDKEILEEMNKIVKILGKHRKEIENISQDQLDEEVQHMIEIVRNELRG
ncbi:MAG: hypothetical protein N4A57_13820 [Anaeromicrobium sp.]|jgi:hypothetical protein|uniref:HMA2 domain-containing protein n=1 Tax=Anaeromicrobium sp. TaxID=1929132 RepID=UPI0025E4CF0F|nr:hypothetical protein [Anaeromicrobium sp.]MCT4595323.1 hypothetical protein [Anaeromicrobium sp.]